MLPIHALALLFESGLKQFHSFPVIISTVAKCKVATFRHGHNVHKKIGPRGALDDIRRIQSVIELIHGF